MRSIRANREAVRWRGFLATGWQRIRALRRPLCCRLQVKDITGSTTGDVKTSRTTGKASLFAQPSDATCGQVHAGKPFVCASRLSRRLCETAEPFRAVRPY